MNGVFGGVVFNGRYENGFLTYDRQSEGEG